MKMKSKILATLVLASAFFLPITTYAEEEGSIDFWKKTKVMGSLDFSYNYNFNRPTTTAAAAAANGYRTFDNRPNAFDPNLFELAVENSPSDWATLRTDLVFGTDATPIHAAGLGATEFIDLEQAYLALKAADVGNGLTFKAGKFVTLHGAEVIEASANKNISRGLLFSYAIPFTHTGLVATYPFADEVSLDLGVVNGWNNVVDNNNGKSVHGMLTIKPMDKLTWFLGGTVGPEAAGNDRTIRTLIDTTLIYALDEAWTFTLNYDWGRDGSLVAAGSSGVADLQGIAAYIDWNSGDLLGLTLRGEHFRDDTLAAAGAAATGATASGKVTEVTLTNHLYLADGLDLRFEFRHDHGNATSFLRGAGASRRFQDTIASQLVYSF
jgi:hypothetical protein